MEVDVKLGLSLPCKNQRVLRHDHFSALVPAAGGGYRGTAMLPSQKKEIRPAYNQRETLA
jgi:hypothetical protein